MSKTILVPAKRPKFNIYKVALVAVRFWYVPMAVLGGSLCWLTDVVADALNYQGFLWIPMVVGVLMIIVGACGVIYNAGVAFFDWYDNDGWSRMVRSLEERSQGQVND